jgi:hypothetical protein
MQYKDIHIKIQCNETCAVLRSSEAISRKRLTVANAALDYLLDLYWQQKQGQAVLIDEEHLVCLLDDLLSGGNVEK